MLLRVDARSLYYGLITCEMESCSDDGDGPIPGAHYNAVPTWKFS